MPRFFGSVGRTWAVSVCALSALSCGPAENDPGPGGVTVGEARALDEAAEMLDERQANPASATEPNQPDPNGAAAAPGAR